MNALRQVRDIDRLKVLDEQAVNWRFRRAALRADPQAPSRLRHSESLI
jgi:hypothetical protein